MGVWIETNVVSIPLHELIVTPYVGVWIETKNPREALDRGLVTPYVGVWIETPSSNVWPFSKKSHPTWVCGLKLFRLFSLNFLACHTLRGCVDWNNIDIARTVNEPSHTLRGCVDWNIISVKEKLSGRGHTLRGCVDWNMSEESFSCSLNSHTLRGCVDWNTFADGGYVLTGVTPYVGVWIETCVLSIHNFKS